MITREEYHKNLRKKKNAINHKKQNDSAVSYRLASHQSNEAQIQSNPPENKTLNEAFFDGFHQVLYVCMRGLHKIWRMFNNISFINNINKKQDASFKRNQSFMVSNWSSKSPKIRNATHNSTSQNINVIKHKLSNKSSLKSRKDVVKKAHKQISTSHTKQKSKSNTKQQHPIKLDKAFVDMMRHK